MNKLQGCGIFQLKNEFCEAIEKDKLIIHKVWYCGKT